MKKIFTVIVVFLLYGIPSSSYRFVCNGILANGEIREDECGVCDDEHAARWGDANLAVTVDSERLPKSLKKRDWEEAVKKSFSAWENISGSSLRFVRNDADSRREFGSNDSLHEIFWITNKEEWRKLVGSGEFGTLGATLPRYSCGGDLGANRVIYDADLVLNGLPHINWEIDCHDDDCISVQTTLVHELGHFFGLDHPCLLCSTSIMSARAGFDLVYPKLDDMQGIRALYPGGENGGFGFPCKKDNDCSADNRCVVEKPHSYCTNDCRYDAECQPGSICKANADGKVCGFFLEEDLDLGKIEGENCMRAPCKEPLVCAGAFEPNFYCYKPCKEDGDCELEMACVKLEEGDGVCVDIKKKGDLCNHRDLCEEHLYCVFDKLNSGYCYAPCRSMSSSKGRCALDEVCEKIEGVDICLPKIHTLKLDEASSGFSHDEGLDLSKTEQKSKFSPKPSGCESIDPRSNNGFSLVLLALSWALIIVNRRYWKQRHALVQIFSSKKRRK